MKKELMGWKCQLDPRGVIYKSTPPPTPKKRKKFKRVFKFSCEYDPSGVTHVESHVKSSLRSSFFHRSLIPCKWCAHTHTHTHEHRLLPTQASHGEVSPSKKRKKQPSLSLSPSVKQIGSPYKGVQKNPHDQSVWEWQPCPGPAIIRPHECLSSPLLSGRRHWQSLTRQWLSHRRKEPAADRGRPHQTRLSRGPPLVNRGNKHLLILTYISAADTHRCALSPPPPLRKDVLPGPPPPPPPHPSLSLYCQVVLVLTSSLPRHKGPLKCLRMLYGCMTGGGRRRWGSESV